MLERTIPTLVTPEWLHRHLEDRDLRIFDATWVLPGSGPSGREEYEAEHIPGAAFFDIDDIADPDTDLPHMLPSPRDFARKAGALGLCDEHRVVFYDARGIYSSPRGWWMLRVFGLHKVAVLDGGLPAWKRAGLPTAKGTASYPAVRCLPHFIRPRVVDLIEMQANLRDKRFQYVDARPADRFSGAVDEPRPGLRRGHLPGSHNVPHDALTQGADGPLRPREELRAIFEQAGVDLTRPIAVGCGSGVTATVAALALEVLGLPEVPVYDGSWTEWARQSDTLAVID